MGLLEQIYEKAKENPQRIAFPEAVNEKMMQAAYETGKEGYIIPVLVGNADEIREALSARGYEEDIFTIVDIREEIYKKKLIDQYVALPHTLLKEKALNRRMQNPLYYAMVMEAVGEADVTFAGIDNTTGDVLLAGQMVIGLKPGISTISSIGLCDIPEFKGRRKPSCNRRQRCVRQPGFRSAGRNRCLCLRHGQGTSGLGAKMRHGQLFHPGKRTGGAGG